MLIRPKCVVTTPSVAPVFAALLFTTLTLGGCDNENVKPGNHTTIEKSEPVAKPDAPIKQSSTANPGTSTTGTSANGARDLLAQAQQKNSPERETLLLQAADIYLDQNKPDKARHLVNEMEAEKLPDEQFVNYSRISALIELKDGHIDPARSILTNPRLERQLNALEPQQEIALREARAQAFERSGQLQESIAERISMTPAITNPQTINANQDALWQTLMNLPLADLQENAGKGAGGITQGWYSLAALSKNNTLDVDAQQIALSKWQKQWSNHPASSNLPKDLRMLQALVNQQPQKIALLLPLQGRLAEAGEAVHDGFFAAYYRSLASNRQMPVIRQYDTSKSAIAAYQQAVADGADLIIGPLDKDDVKQISQLPKLSVPVLSLNYPDPQPENVIPNFYQFGLAVEDEARQVARQGIQDGRKNALVVAPSLDWSERSVQAFSDEWKKLGGTLVGRTLFTDQDHFSQAIRSTMLIDESQARATLLQQQLGTKFEFIPRRRADIDMIFMAVTPTQGRQIKPTLAFHYANTIPVYATSNVYAGDVDTINNEDLNGVVFNTLPWLFDENNPEKQSITQNTKSSAVYGRLHALGADAYHLYARLPQLKQVPQTRIYGATGSLHLLPDGRIEREEMWARFENGLVQVIPSVVDQNENNGDQ